MSEEFKGDESTEISTKQQSFSTKESKLLSRNGKALIIKKRSKS